MKKNSPFFGDEINLFALFTVIWNGKIKIFLITIFAYLIGFGYSLQLPKNYVSTLIIKASKNSEFEGLESFNNLLKDDQKKISFNPFNRSNEPNLSNVIILGQFIKELRDYDEFLFYLKNSKKVKDRISKLSTISQEKELYKYANLLKIIEPDKDQPHLILKFTWHDFDEAQNILEKALKLTINNLSKSTFETLNKSLNFKKRFYLNKDKQRLNFLYEQSSIAKVLDMAENQQLESVNLPQSSGLFDVSVNTSPNTNSAYYLRGYKAIDKEIELIKDRRYQNIEYFEQELELLKKMNINWVDYNTYLTQVTSLSKKKFILMTSILLGLMIGIFYTLISNELQFQGAYKKRTTKN